MRNVSIIALLSAGLFAAAGAFAQGVSVEVSTEVSTEVSVSAPDVSSALSSVSSELSSAVSSASSEVSSAVSSVSSELSSSEMSSSEMMSSEPVNCGTGSTDVNLDDMLVAPLDANALAAVTSVTVIGIGDCSGLQEIDGNAVATLSTHPAVIAARAAAGETGGDIIAYSLSDASLTVYVKR